MKCDIVVVSWNHLEFLRPCIEHITQNTHYPYRLIVIDNASDFETINYLENLKNNATSEIVLIKNEKNLGFVKAINQGIKVSNAPYACIFNNDTLPGQDWLSELIEFAEKHPDVGLLNPLCKGHTEQGLTVNPVRNIKGSVLESKISNGVNDYAKMLSSSNKGKYMEMNQCQGFCMLVKREVIEKIGYLDERFDTVGFDDTDYSMRAHIAGYRSVSVHSSYVYHREHASFGKMGDRKKIQGILENRYFEKWPRHLRFAVIFSVSKNTSDEEIANFLRSALFLAREWCWVNLMIFGDKAAGERMEALKKRGNFPLHQNIKFNYLNRKFKMLEITARILERSFGRKKRKKYDAVICGERGLLPFLKFLCSFQKSISLSMDFAEFSEKKLKEIIKPFRKDGLKQKSSTKCDIILPVCDQYEFTKKCVENILKNADTQHRLIIINNGRNPETRNFLEELSRNKDVETTIVHNDRNIGWVKALNQGIELSLAPYVCFQNSDTIVTPGWLRKMIDILQSQENFGMINPTWEGRPRDMEIDRYGSMLEKLNSKLYIETDWCRGFSTVIKRAVIEKIGKVDERYGLGYLDDVDYSIRAIEAGFSCIRALDTYVYHEGNVTANKVLGDKWDELHERNKLIRRKKWGDPLKIVIILNRKVCRRSDILNRVEDIVFYLAREQHHIDIWSPRKFNNKFRHTNVKLKVYPLLLKFFVSFDLYTNKKKKPEKRYDAVFNYDHKHSNFNEFIKETADKMKEKTKSNEA